MNYPRCFLCAALAIEVVLITGLRAWTSAQSAQDTPQFRSDITLSTIEVSVFDRNGTPVTGLSEGDFTLFEGKKPRTIERVLEFGNSAVRVSPPELGSHENSGQSDGQFFVILLDDGLIEPNPTVAARVKETAITILASLRPSDSAAVLFTGNTRNSVDFTFDRPRLIDAVKSFRSSGNHAVGSEADMRSRNALSTLEALAKQLGQVAHGRKAVFYVSTGVNLPPPMTQGYAMIVQIMQRVFVAAERSNLTIYTVDPGGLVSGPGTSVAESAMPGPGRAMRNLSRHDFLRILADNTGGRAIVDTNSPSYLADKAVVASRHYYVVAYEAPESIKARRHLTVKVNSPRAATVRFRAADPVER